MSRLHPSRKGRVINDNTTKATNNSAPPPPPLIREGKASEFVCLCFKINTLNKLSNLFRKSKKNPPHKTPTWKSNSCHRNAKTINSQACDVFRALRLWLAWRVPSSANTDLLPEFLPDLKLTVEVGMPLPVLNAGNKWSPNSFACPQGMRSTAAKTHEEKSTTAYLVKKQPEKNKLSLFFILKA